MDLRRIVLLTFQVSIFCTVFGFGLRATLDDLLYLVRRPGLLARSLVAVFVIMPIVAVVLARLFNFRQTVEIALIALAISPVPPLLPTRMTIAGARQGYALGLLTTLAALAIVTVPLALDLFGLLFGRAISIAPGAIAGVVGMSIVPLTAGVVVHAALPAIAARIYDIVALVGRVLLVIATVTLLAAVATEMWALLGNGTLIAMVAFAVIGLAVGHVLGGPEPDHSTALALASACRHPAIAYSIATASRPDMRFGGAIVLYLIVSALVAIPYIAWQRQHLAARARA